MRCFGKLVVLGRLLIRAVAWNGLTTSGVEQTFTLLDLRVGLQGVGLSVSSIVYLKTCLSFLQQACPIHPSKLIGVVDDKAEKVFIRKKEVRRDCDTDIAEFRARCVHQAGSEDLAEVLRND